MTTFAGAVNRLRYRRRNFRTEEDYLRYFLIEMGFLTGVMLITGKPGAGKTLFAVAMARWIKKLFNRGVTMDFHPKRAFGKYQFFDHRQVIEQLKRVDKVAGGNAEWMSQNDSIFFNRTIIFDESYKIFHNRRGMGSLPLLMGDILKQWRHYQSMFMLIAPNANEMDEKLVNQLLTMDVSCSWGVYRSGAGTYLVYNRDLMIAEPISLVGNRYYPLYNSFNPITMRQRVDYKV